MYLPLLGAKGRKTMSQINDSSQRRRSRTRQEPSAPAGHASQSVYSRSPGPRPERPDQQPPAREKPQKKRQIRKSVLFLLVVFAVAIAALVMFTPK